MGSSRFVKLANGDVYDNKLKKLITNADGTRAGVNADGSETKPKKPPRPKNETKAEKADKLTASKAHAVIARETMELNHDKPINRGNAKELWERGMWYWKRCEELGATPIPQGLVNAWGFKAYEENLLLSGNSGLNAECREVISEFKQALEMVAEGGLVDTTSGVVGKIFDLKNRFGWSDTGNLTVETGQNFGEIATKEELKKAIMKMPGLDLIDEPMAIDAEFEVIEG